MREATAVSWELLWVAVHSVQMGPRAVQRSWEELRFSGQGRVGADGIKQAQAQHSVFRARGLAPSC